MRINVPCSLLLLALTTVQPSLASIIAVLPGSGGFQNSNYGSNITLGWGFTLTDALTITDLGYFDGNTGLTDSHPVGIWNSLGNLIAEATVPGGTAGALVNGFRFVSITPVVLNPGAYSIGGYANMTSPDEFRFEVSSVATVAGLSFGPANLYTQADSLTRPTTKADAFSQDGFFGPDFLVSGPVTVVPEPAGAGISLLGLAIIVGFRRLGPGVQRIARKRRNKCPLGIHAAFVFRPRGRPSSSSSRGAAAYGGLRSGFPAT